MSHSLVLASLITTIGALLALVVATQYQNMSANRRLALPSSSPSPSWAPDEWSALACEWNTLALALVGADEAPSQDDEHDEDEAPGFIPLALRTHDDEWPGECNTLAYVQHEDHEAIRCTLPENHEGAHEDHSRATTTGEIVSWRDPSSFADLDEDEAPSWEDDEDEDDDPCDCIACCEDDDPRLVADLDEWEDDEAPRSSSWSDLCDSLLVDLAIRSASARIARGFALASS